MSHSVPELKSELLHSLGAGHPFNESSKTKNPNLKSYGTVEVFEIEKPKLNYQYLLIDEKGIIHDKIIPENEDPITLRSLPLVRLTTTFTVECERVNAPGSRDLLRKVTIKTRLNTHVHVSVQKCTVEYAARAKVSLDGVQNEANYQLIDNEGLVLSPILAGNETGQIELETYPLYESTDLNIRVTQTKTGRTAFLNQSPFVRVRPKLDLHVYADKTNVTLGDSFNVIVENTQRGVSYQVHYSKINEAPVQDLNLNLSCSEIIEGTGGDIQILSKPFCDGTLVVYALKEDFYRERLDESIDVQITPPTTARVRAISEWIPSNTTAIIGVSPIIENMEYRLVNDDTGEVVCAVKNNAAKEIGQGRVGIDFMIYKTIDDEIELESQSLTEDTNFSVQVVNMNTGLHSVLLQKAFIQVGGDKLNKPAALRKGIVHYAKQ